ncbi:unnamed protein product, partial [Gulo gulo]
AVLLGSAFNIRLRRQKRARSSRCLLEPACGHPQTLVRRREIGLGEAL